MLILLVVALVICLLVAKFTFKGQKLWKFCLINALAIVIYNLIGWIYIFNSLNGGASFGPGLVLMFITILHIVALFILVIVKGIIQSVKEQAPK
jgi:hypothetical protein